MINLLKGLNFLIILVTSYLLLVTPVHAKVDIGDTFGFGNIRSLAEGTQKLITPTFSIATTLVIIYFLFGAFKYLKSGGNKEEIEGARQMIIHAIIGFIILMFAFLILQFLLSRLFGTNFGIQIF